jgi:hypothetical protein
MAWDGAFAVWGAVGCSDPRNAGRVSECIDERTGQVLRFEIVTVDLTLVVAVTWSGIRIAGIKWWPLEASAEVSREKVVTPNDQTDPDPVALDAHGKMVSAVHRRRRLHPRPGRGWEGVIGRGRRRLSRNRSLRWG